VFLFFFFSSRRRHTRFSRDWSSDVCSSDLIVGKVISGVVYMRAALAVLNTSFLGVIKSTLAWTAALLTNPITWIVVGITALVAALVWFFTKTEAGRAIIQAVWGAIKSAMGAVVDWWTETAAPALIGAWE